MRPRGFSLLEAFLVMILITLVVLVLIGLYPSAMAGMRKADQLNSASDLAQELLEEARATPFSKLQSRTVPRNVDGIDYRAELVIQDATPPDPNLRWAIVTVTWTSSKPMSLTYRACVYNFTNP